MDGGAATYDPAHEAVKEMQGLRKDLWVKPLVITIGSGPRPQTKTSSFQSIVSKSIDTVIQAQEN